MASNYEQLVKALRCCSSGECGKCDYEWNPKGFCADTMCADAAAAIEALQAERDEWIDRCYRSDEKVAELSEKVAELQAEVKDAFNEGYNAGYTAGIGYCSFKRAKQPHWVSVEERLPKEKENKNYHDFEYVLCSTTFGDVRPYKFGTPIGWDEPHFWHGAGLMDKYVTHWMPLPEPPQEV